MLSSAVGRRMRIECESVALIYRFLLKDFHSVGYESQGYVPRPWTPPTRLMKAF